MTTKVKPKVSKKILTKAREVLEFAEQRAREAASSSELSNALFAPGGKATLAFSTLAERTAFCKTPEYKRILELMEGLPRPPITEVIDLTGSPNGTITVRLPRSVHAALLAEAEAEGVSLNQLCVAKLAVQLRAVV